MSEKQYRDLSGFEKKLGSGFGKKVLQWVWKEGIAVGLETWYCSGFGKKVLQWV
ncbi:MAG: hypothetical protein IPM26_03460 [Saprospiraceae bacterium]|nr:hypothetical protein [Saprospiraceae bacterium]